MRQLRWRCGPREVSIRTRHLCRVMQTQFGTMLTETSFNPHPASLPGDAQSSADETSEGSSRFNPHPASLPGDAGAPQGSPEVYRVSIRTRHLCRVMLYRSPQRLKYNQFQSAPGISAG